MYYRDGGIATSRRKPPGCRRAAGPALRSLLDVGLHVIDGLLHRSDLLGFLVGDLALELFLERHDQLDGVQRIRSEVVDERGAVGDLVFLDAKLFDHDLLDALFDAAHGYSLLLGDCSSRKFTGKVGTWRMPRPGDLGAA